MRIYFIVGVITGDACFGPKWLGLHNALCRYATVDSLKNGVYYCGLKSKPEDWTRPLISQLVALSFEIGFTHGLTAQSYTARLEDMAEYLWAQATRSLIQKTMSNTNRLFCRLMPEPVQQIQPAP